MKISQICCDLPNFSTLSRRQKTLDVGISYTASKGAGLHLLVDSTDIKFLGKGEWKRKKHGADYRRQWRKVHLGIDAETFQIRAVLVTDNSIGDAPILPDLLAKIPADEVLLSVAGRGYATKPFLLSLYQAAAGKANTTHKHSIITQNCQPCTLLIIVCISNNNKLTITTA
jgi:hypothetical protein